MQIDDDYSDDDWGEDSYRGGNDLKLVEQSVFMIKDAIMSFKLYRDSTRTRYNGDQYWFKLETKALNQVFNLYNNIPLGKKYVEKAVNEVKIE